MKLSLSHAVMLGAIVAASTGIGDAFAAQPHMTSSLSMLRSARGELAAATPNKGGHRARGLTLIDQAIAEAEAGIAFGAGRR